VSLWTILVNYREGFLHGLAVTGQLCGVIWIFGLLLGVPLGAVANRYPRTIGLGFRLSTFIVSSIPAIVLLVWAHYPAQAMLGVVIDPFITAATVLTAVNILGVGDTVRAALAEFPRGALDAARVCGLTPRETFRHIQFPLLLRHVSPALLQQQVVMLHATLFASLISVEEIFRVSQRINAQVYRPIEVFSALAVFFLAICLPLNAIAAVLSRRLRRADRMRQEAT
jgi:polar amino acid transport system permease protein